MKFDSTPFNMDTPPPPLNKIRSNLYGSMVAVLTASHCICINLSDYVDVHVGVVVQFCPLFKFYFPLFYTHYHSSPYTKTKEDKN